MRPPNGPGPATQLSDVNLRTFEKNVEQTLDTGNPILCLRLRNHEIISEPERDPTP